ncbi:MAG TPA: hypothetical protein VFS65_01715 [Candidatus Saccharimonadales bacterium]|nr:hypothetical protein [Candidatus Saccharimonadales bacterium]
MTEMCGHGSSGEIGNRAEYCTDNEKVLSHLQYAVLSQVEDLLLSFGLDKTDTQTSSHFNDTLGHRSKSIHYIGRDVSDFEDDETLYSDGGLVQCVRQPVETHVYLEHEVYYGEAKFEQYIIDIDHYVRPEVAKRPFVERYTIELFRGGTVLGSVEVTDVIRTKGLDGRTMTPYDYSRLQKELDTARAWELAQHTERVTLGTLTN